MILRFITGLFAVLSLTTIAAAQPEAVLEDDAPIEQVLLHPMFAAPHSCAEHYAGQLRSIGDALGTDCYVTGPVATPGGGMFFRPYRTDGLTNEDWFSWGEPVRAGLDAEVVRVNVNPVVNTPGVTGRPPASFVLLRAEDGVMVLYAHIADPAVAEGDRVTAGQPIAVVGNNGFGRSPHIHIGAWRGVTPLQIRWDQRAMGALMAAEN